MRSASKHTTFRPLLLLAVMIGELVIGAAPGAIELRDYLVAFDEDRDEM